MSPESTTRSTAWPARRLVRWAGLAAALLAVGWAGWYFGVELPDEREAAAQAAALAVQRAANARTIPELNLDLVWIAPGSFLMGTPEPNFLVKWYYAARQKLTQEPNPDRNFAEERPATWVTLTHPFWLGRTAVTQGQFEAVMGFNPSAFKSVGRDAPVECVSWENAMAFCQRLTERETAAGRRPAGYAYTLPTEAQREFACRAGTTGDYAGDLDAMAWYADISGGTSHPVGTKQPNAWGLYDMHGDVWEWCRDWYGPYPGGEVTNPAGPSSGTHRVVRGGCWLYGAAECRSAFRFDGGPAYLGFDLGFRVALAPTP
jgi:formylglycine-generating enzyme required for sulfatase activity